MTTENNTPKTEYIYKTCNRCCYDVQDEDGDILEHYCIDGGLY